MTNPKTTLQQRIKTVLIVTLVAAYSTYGAKPEDQA